ncbi:hypothetical protein CRENBAI_002749 [Crenichthys baileyi]|uniref:Secreted protein n=1 Tax=Crenichthys baileyi TaxID=28760 RepID=A0AAV9R5J3_9TELE
MLFIFLVMFILFYSLTPPCCPKWGRVDPSYAFNFMYLFTLPSPSPLLSQRGQVDPLRFSKRQLICQITEIHCAEEGKRGKFRTVCLQDQSRKYFYRTEKRGNAKDNKRRRVTISSKKYHIRRSIGSLLT